MDLIRRILSKTIMHPELEDLTRLAGRIGGLLDKMCLDIVDHYAEVLLENSSYTYVVFAVYGETGIEPADSIRHKMHDQISTIVEGAMRLFKFKGLLPEQEYAFQYIIRGYVSTRILFMVESLKALSASNRRKEEPDRMDLSCLQPIGRA